MAGEGAQAVARGAGFAGALRNFRPRDHPRKVSPET